MTAPPSPQVPPDPAAPSMVAPRPDLVPIITLDPARSLVYRTPVQDQPGTADAKAAAVLTVVARFSATLADAVGATGPTRVMVVVTLGGFGVCALGAVVQASARSRRASQRPRRRSRSSRTSPSSRGTSTCGR
ncbi:MAG TPA: hypothetical protein VK324_03930 [Tepidisphaeraceae bacterium]|nr:hypothetical protein [Tepidisphaeraceae bacterium]